MKRGKHRQAHRRNARKRRQARRSRPRNSRRVGEARIRDFAAINGVRKGKYDSLSVAALAEGTTVQSIKRLLPGALLPSRPGKAIRVRATDRYTQLVQILDSSGQVAQVVAHGSRERELSGQHRATCMGVLDGRLPATALKRFRGKKVGGRKLLTNPERLFALAHGGVVDNLAPLYVSPEASA